MSYFIHCLYYKVLLSYILIEVYSLLVVFKHSYLFKSVLSLFIKWFHKIKVTSGKQVNISHYSSRKLWVSFAVPFIQSVTWISLQNTTTWTEETSKTLKVQVTETPKTLKCLCLSGTLSEKENSRSVSLDKTTSGCSSNPHHGTSTPLTLLVRNLMTK